MMADELLNAQDLITAKKHDTFHSEAITGKTGGLSTGADIDYATNAVTGQVQKTLPKILDDLDWSYVGKFADGVTFTDKTDFAVDAVGTQWIYTGNYPFTATAGTVPSEPTYQAVHVKSASAISNANGGSVQDFIDETNTFIDNLDQVHTRTFDNVDAMLAFNGLLAGHVYSTGGTDWEYLGGGNTIDKFKPISAYVCVDDFFGTGNSVTDAISSALSVGADAYIRPEPNKVLTVEGGVLYLREGQELNCNFTQLKLRDDYNTLNDIGGSILEMSSNSTLRNTYLDGSALTYKNGLDAITDFDLTPFSHGVYTSRLSTNNNVYIGARGVSLHNVFVTNTIRSGIVFTGKDIKFSRISSVDSYCDHWLYFMTVDGVYGEHAMCGGSFREEGLVFDGREGSRATNVTINSITVNEPVLTEYPYRNVFFRIIHARDCDESTSGKLTFTLNEVNVISKENLSSNLVNSRQIRFGSGWLADVGRVHIDITLNQTNLPLIESQCTNVSIDHLNIGVSSNEAVAIGNVNILNTYKALFTGSRFDIGTLNFRSTATFLNTSFLVRNSGATMNINAVDIDADGIKLFKLYSTSSAIRTIVGDIHSSQQVVSAFEAVGSNSNIFTLNSSNQTSTSTSNAPRVGVNKVIKMSGALQVANFSDVVDGVRFFVVGNGTAQILNTAYIKTKSGGTITPQSGGAVEFIRIDSVCSEL